MWLVCGSNFNFSGFGVFVMRTVCVSIGYIILLTLAIRTLLPSIYLLTIARRHLLPSDVTPFFKKEMKERTAKGLVQYRDVRCRWRQWSWE